MNKQQLATKIWESANRMRSKIEANEYKDYILGFIFYKYLSDKEKHWFMEQDCQEDDIKKYADESDEETVKFVQKSLGYFIAYDDLFSTWIKMGSDFSVDNVRTALSSFSRLISPSHKDVFAGIFNTLETGLSKLGTDAKSQTKAVRDLIYLIDEIPMDRKQDYDVLGFIYEYLIANFAANAGKKAGEFYTPHEVSVLMSEIIANHLKGRTQIKIYDPTSGSGSLLINIGNAIRKYMDSSDHIVYYAQELKVNTYNLTRMNLVMRGILPDNIVTRNADTLEDDWPLEIKEEYKPLYVDAVVSNPPYSQRWDPANKESDQRYARYGLAPKTKADYAFLLHDLYHLKPNGLMTIVLPHGVLFRGGDEGKIRKNLIEQNNIEAIIGLPANIFYGTGIPTIIMVLRQKREATDVLIVDASKGFIKENKSNKLRACDIRKIVDAVKNRKSIPKYAKLVSREEIRQNDYNLNIPRYVDSSKEAESYDIYATIFGGIPAEELKTLDQYWAMFPNLKAALFEGKKEYLSLKAQDIKKTVIEDADVQNFIAKFKAVFADFGKKLAQLLIDNADSISIAKAEEMIAKDIFARFANLPLLDAYEAYEIFEQQYEKVAGDLELIQTEGIDAVKKIDPHMVAKKKNGKECMVQEGWIGHILPFELVQKLALADDVIALNDKQIQLDDIGNKYAELIEVLSEDDKLIISEALNGENDAFVAKNIKSVIKELREDSAEYKNLISTLQSADQLSKEEKNLKKEIKQSEIDLHLKTKEKIENLTTAEINALLYEKWIAPIERGIAALVDSEIDTFEKGINHLADKYALTMHDIESDIKKAENELCAMLSELTGSEADMAGIREFQKMLGGGKNEE